MESNYEIVYMSAYLNDVHKIYNNLAYILGKKDKADKLLKKINLIISDIKGSPYMFAKLQTNNKNMKNERRAIIDNYILTYEVDSQEKIISIDRLFHGKENYLN